jgi:hypothetical protein
LSIGPIFVQTQATDSLEATLSAVTDATGAVRQLAEAYKISIVKTPVYATYPLSFLRVRIQSRG